MRWGKEEHCHCAASPRTLRANRQHGSTRGTALVRRHAELVDDSEKAEKKIQWVAGKDALQIKVIVPDLLFINEEFNKDSLQTHEVITESAYSNLKDDAEIQFVRLGYYRKESSHQAIFTHK